MSRDQGYYRPPGNSPPTNRLEAIVSASALCIGLALFIFRADIQRATDPHQEPLPPVQTEMWGPENHPLEVSCLGAEGCVPYEYLYNVLISASTDNVLIGDSACSVAGGVFIGYASEARRLPLEEIDP